MRKPGRGYFPPRNDVLRRENSTAESRANKTSLNLDELRIRNHRECRVRFVRHFDTCAHNFNLLCQRAWIRILDDQSRRATN